MVKRELAKVKRSYRAKITRLLAAGPLNETQIRDKMAEAGEDLSLHDVALFCSGYFPEVVGYNVTTYKAK